MIEAWIIYLEMWQEMPVIGYPWLMLATIIPVVPAMCIYWGIKETRCTAQSAAD